MAHKRLDSLFKDKKRHFDGTVYYFYAAGTKAWANDSAKKLRNEGGLVRIIPYKDGGKTLYEVWARKK